VNAVQKALDNWRSAIEARDVALDRAVENVYSQFAAIVVRREKEYDDALRRSKEAGDEMAD
jgi:hypothetical protein